jgi:ketosteroid isomerase-like protein
MSEENVEVVRRYFELIVRMLDDYWSNPVTLSEYPPIDQAFADVDPEAEWTPPYLGNAIRGKEAWLAAISDWLDAADDWRIHVESVSDLGQDHVLVTSRNAIRGRDSGVQIDQGIFTVVTVQSGKITAISDFTERQNALEAAGLSE